MLAFVARLGDRESRRLAILEGRLDGKRATQQRLKQAEVSASQSGLGVASSCSLCRKPWLKFQTPAAGDIGGGLSCPRKSGMVCVYSRGTHSRLEGGGGVHRVEDCVSVFSIWVAFFTLGRPETSARLSNAFSQASKRPGQLVIWRLCDWGIERSVRDSS